MVAFIFLDIVVSFLIADIGRVRSLDMTLEVWDGAFEDVPLRTLGAVTTYIASASYGLPYLPANAQSDSVPRVGALALSVAMLFTFQGARCAGCEPLTFIAFVLSPFYIYYYSCCVRKNQLFFALFSIGISTKKCVHFLSISPFSRVML